MLSAHVPIPLDWVLNTHTDTLHRLHKDRDQRETKCGALAHVSPEHVETGSEQTAPDTDCCKLFPDSVDSGVGVHQ